MRTKVLLLLMVVFSGKSLLASEVASNSQPQQSTCIWRYINFSIPKPAAPWDGSPGFLITSGQQWDQVSRGLRLDIMGITQGFAFFKTNAIVARLHWANGEVVDPTTDGKKMLNAPVAVSTASIPGEKPNPQVLTYFPWGTNALQEAWIEVSIASERYWLEIPYGFARNPADPLPPAIPGGPPRFVPAMDSLTEHDHVVRWENVHYQIGKTPDGRELTLIQSNPFDAQSSIDLYRFPKNQDLYSPHTSVRVLKPDGSVSEGKCVDLHLDDNHLRRTDTFDLFDRSSGDLRCWGRIEVKIDDQSFNISVPSSLYKYVHGHASKPAAVDFISNLRLGMAFKDVERRLHNYNVTRKSAKIVEGCRQNEYVFTPDAGAVMLRFDKSDRLQSWEGSSK